jgi:hypothetical protein
MSIAYEMMKYLENQGFGIESTNLFVGFKPDDPDDLIVLYDDPGPNLAESSDLDINISTIHIIVRNSIYLTCEETINRIHSLVTGFGGNKLIPNGSNINYITQEVPPSSIGKDNDNRNEWSAYYNVRFMSNYNDQFRT